MVVSIKISFAQFGSELDQASQQAIDRGQRAIEILKQPQRETYSFVDQTLFLLLLKEHFLDNLALKDVRPCAVQFASFIKETHAEIYNQIFESKDITDQNITDLKIIADKFVLIFKKQ